MGRKPKIKSEEEIIQELKSSLEAKEGREFSPNEMYDIEYSFRMFSKVLYENIQTDHRNEERLKENPIGFSRAGNCRLCGIYSKEEEGWFDKNGQKCMNCQKGIDAGVVPLYVIKYKGSWYSGFELKSFFNLSGKEQKNLVKNGILKQRVILNEKGKPHLDFFLLADNKRVIPSKKMLKSRVVWVVRKDGNYHTTLPWYEFSDFALMKRLSKYKIFSIMKEAFNKPIEDRGMLLSKPPNPLFELKDGEPTACLNNSPAQ